MFITSCFAQPQIFITNHGICEGDELKVKYFKYGSSRQNFSKNLYSVIKTKNPTAVKDRNVANQLDGIRKIILKVIDSETAMQLITNGSM